MYPIKFSIIVPIYNVENYLKECLDCVINQTYKNLEIILVNDGSTDTSGEIAKSYAKQDSRIVYLEQKNCGLSIARNTGLKYAMGGGSDYIYFVDSDDYLESNAIDNIAQVLLHNKVDFICCNSYYSVSNNKEKKEYVFLPKQYELKLISTQNILQDFPCIHFYNVWLFVYNKDFLAKHHLLFEPNIFFEDVLFASYAFSLADKIIITPTPAYNYRISRDGSIMNTLSKVKIYHSVYSYFTIAKRFFQYKTNATSQLKKEYFLFCGCFYLKQTLRKLQLTGYAKDLGFSKDDLRAYLPYIKGKYRFCFHFPRIYGFPKKVRLFIVNTYTNIIQKALRN